ncbi:MAG: hypothetical protein KF758_13555 [Anaerolineales bacterium]|nr:hypothetical protein [Anaerolineales bacterium]MBX3037930.1 hypothetical protein [Anaerolineales bacterium]
MKQALSTKQFIFFIFISGAIHAVFLIIGSSFGIIIGLIIGTVEIDLLNKWKKQNPIYFFIIALMNIAIAASFITFYCFFFLSIACDRNPILLSLTPAVPLSIFGISLLFNRLLSWIKFMLNNKQGG